MFTKQLFDREAYGALPDVSFLDEIWANMGESSQSSVLTGKVDFVSISFVYSIIKGLIYKKILLIEEDDLKFSKVEEGHTPKNYCDDCRYLGPVVSYSLGDDSGFFIGIHGAAITIKVTVCMTQAVHVDVHQVMRGPQ